MQHVYVDESGDVGAPAKDDRYFVVAALVVNKKTSSALQRRMMRLNSDLGVPLGGELKAVNAAWEERDLVLSSLATMDVSIVTAEANKRQFRELRNREDLYREAVTDVAEYCIDQWSLAEFTLDHRFPSENTIVSRIRSVAEGRGMKPPKIGFAHSTQDVCLQAADYVAWIFHRVLEDSVHTRVREIFNKLEGRVTKRLPVYKIKIRPMP